MKGRHPHLYGEGPEQPWEQMKAKRRDSIVDGLPADLPALHRAFRLQDRAAGVGFDWPGRRRSDRQGRRKELQEGFARKPPPRPRAARRTARSAPVPA